MKILIGQSYFRVLDPKELDRKMPYPPLGTLYAAMILKRSGHDVIFYDAMLSENPEEFIEVIKKENPGLLLIYDDEFNYLTKMCLSNMRNAAESFIRAAKKLSIPVIVYSSDATDFPRPYLSAGCDAIIYGEGEQALQEIINSYETNDFDEKKYKIDGLKFISDDKIYQTQSREMLSNIDSLPNPDYSFVDMNKYRELWLSNHGYYSLNISTTRGCPYKCNWCAKPLYGKIYNSRSPLRVALQIKDLKEEYGIDHLWITDDIFGLKPGWVEQFAIKCRELKISVPYKCLSRPDLLLRGNTIQALKDSGCSIIWIGAESGSQKILDAMDKGTTFEQIYEAAQKVHEAGMEIAFFIQYGYPGENWNDIKLTRKMIRSCLPEDIGISVSYPLPGTKFYETVKEQMKEKTNWTDSDDLDMMYIGTYERTFYKILHRFTHAEYRIAKIIKQRKWSKFPNLINHLIQYTKYRIKLMPHLNKEILSPSINMNRS
jgi:radical SAM superfamily enzyme YgiQ (UPF0313 family)